MSVQSGGHRLRLSTLNEQLTCKLCGGYYIDATTIIECLHSFCKSCIVKYLENNKFCPICDAHVHKNKPLLNIRPDQILQDIVYKLVPGCYQNEMRFRKDFYAKYPEEKNNVVSPESRGEPIESYIYSPDESLSLSLEYYSPKVIDEVEYNRESSSKLLPRRYLRCPAAVTVFHLQKLIRAKYGLSEAHRVDIMYKEELLCASYTLMDIMYIYHWRRKVPLHLSYRIFESSPKRLKLSEDNDEFKQSVSNNNMKFESKNDELLIKREWKEVQLKISESGVMSVTDISSLDTKKSTKINEINQQSNLYIVSSKKCNVNKTLVKTENIETLKPCCTVLSKNIKMQQDNLTNKIEHKLEEELNNVLSKTISTVQNNLKNEKIELKSINQHDLSNELLTTSNDKNESNCSKATTDSCQISNIGKQSQMENIHQHSKIKTEIFSISDKCKNSKQNVMIDNFLNREIKLDAITKHSMKFNDMKITPSAGSKINALSAKLQFQPKIGQVNNTYSKKLMATEKKAISSPIKVIDTKVMKTSSKSELNVISDVSSNNCFLESGDPNALFESLSCSITHSTISSQSNIINTAVSIPLVSSDCSVLQPLAAPTSESLASIGLHVSTTMPNQSCLSGWMNEQDTLLNKTKIPTSLDKSVSSDQQLHSLQSLPQIDKNIICSTTSTSPTCSMGRFSIQTPSMSIYSITTSTKNNFNTGTIHSYKSTTKKPSIKTGLDMTNMYPVPPCPDSIPISLMKPLNPRKEVISKGTTLNDICAKISGTGTGSKINDICAKIGESSKEKSKIETQRNKPEVPDLLKISKKILTPVSEIPVSVTHIPNIPNIPIYTPSNNQILESESDSKDAIKKLSSSVTPSQPVIMSAHMQKVPTQKKHSQTIGYKTLRDPPKSWNPTLSKNNYVAVKNQAKEIQNQSQGLYGSNADNSSASKQIPSKPAKIFKIRNMPRYLGNPASGVKPMYGITNDQSKDKEQEPSCGVKSGSMSMMKIDPQTLSPIVSSSNSPIVSPPPYSPTARSYQGSPFNRDICRNSSNSPISPRNSPVNMLSTNPFIPSHTPNTNPRIIYSHFPPVFSDANRFSNPLIRSPIGIPPPSAFHSSLPPSINNLYQRSGYMSQTSITGFSVGATNQPPTVQRIPPSSHASTLPKTSTSTTSGSSINLTRMDQSQSPTQSSTMITTTSSIVDSVALQLAKGLIKRDIGLFDLTRSENFKSNSETIQQTSLHPACGSSTKVLENNIKLKSSSKIDLQGPGIEENFKQNNIHADVKGMLVSATTKEVDRKEISPAKLNGSIAIPILIGEKSKDIRPELRSDQHKDTMNCVKSTLCSSLSKFTSCKSETVQKISDEICLKQNKFETEGFDSKPLLQLKNPIIEVLKGKAEL